MRLLYSLFALYLLITIIWTSFSLSYPNSFGNGIEKAWYMAIVTGSLCLILILATFFISSLKNSPINMVVYIVFAICFMHFVGWLCLKDKTMLCYYGLWLVYALALSMAIYAWSV